MTRKRFILRKNDGFTLIEIIAVLIILGILAAVAVPKYLDMTDDAHQSAVDGALAAAIGTFNMELSDYLAGNKTMPANLAAINLGVGVTVGDFTVSYVGDGTDVTVTITAGPTWFPGNIVPALLSKKVASTLQ